MLILFQYLTLITRQPRFELALANIRKMCKVVLHLLSNAADSELLY